MIWILQNWKTIALGCLIAIASYASWNAGKSSIQAKWDEERHLEQQEAMEAMQAHAEMIQTMEIKHDENISTINSLALDNKRLRLRPASCAGTSNSGSVVQAPAGDGALHQDASEIIADYSGQIGLLFIEADKVIEDCRVSTEYLKSLAK